MYYILFALAIFLTTPTFAGQQEYELKAKEFVDQGKWLPFHPAVPDNFVMKPMTPDGQLGLGGGVVWGTNDTIDEIWGQYKKNPDAPFKNTIGIFRAHLSTNVVQVKSEPVKIDENEFQANLKQMGAKEVTYRSVKWGEYPITIVEVTFSKRKPLAIAWMGLNEGGAVVLIDYVFPDNQSSYDKDWEIWKKFMCETKAVPLEEIKKAIAELEKAFNNPA